MTYAHIPDPNFRAALNAKLGQPEDAPITIEQLNGLEVNSLVNILTLDDQGIRDLTGAEYLTNLDALDLSDNLISDLSPLANLTNLKGLALCHNRISNLTPLANLTNLQTLRLGHASIGPIEVENLKRLLPNTRIYY